MNKSSVIGVVCFVFLFTSLCFGEKVEKTGPMLSIPASGNSWVVNNPVSEQRIITRKGIEGWTNSDSIIRTFFRVEQTGSIDIAIRARVRSGQSEVSFRFGDKCRKITLTKTEYENVPVGTFSITEAGYHYLDMQGLKKSASTFADVTDILIGGEAARGKVYFVKEDFYFGRRGPSVHLRYEKPEEASDILYFYNELTIPKGEDVQGSYFMANGFGQGYFGIQVNSPEERRILFSVWSPYKTDNPKEIPADQRIKLLKKGKDVNAGKFGGEGSGGQSYRKYMWKTDTTYRFLLKGNPVGDNFTDFTAWFYAPEIGKWELIASFRRPETGTYLTKLYSFLENFIPSMGQFVRKGFYGNQWIYDSQGNWFEIVQAEFTADATARKESRLDYAGGVEGRRFYLKNCGFFNERTEMGTIFTRKANGRHPDIDFEVLP
jgi:Domain of unknown function (DUF3472)/Domain of unknown function (DUF5077)